MESRLLRELCSRITALCPHYTELRPRTGTIYIYIYNSKPLPALAESPRKIKATELSEGLFLEQKSIFSGGMDNLELQTDELVEGGGEIEGDEIPGTPIRKPKEEEFQSPTRVKIDDPLLEFLTQLKFNRIGVIYIYIYI